MSEPDPSIAGRQHAAPAAIAIVDDHPIMRDAVQEIVRAIQPDRPVHGFGSLAELERARSQPGMVLLDLSLPGSEGVSSLVSARALFPETSIVVFSGDDSRDTILACLNAGASGYIVKTSSRAQLVAAIGVVLSGGVFVPPQSLSLEREGATAARASPMPSARGAAGHGPPACGRPEPISPMHLTPRQCDVLSLLVRGLPNKLICRRLDLSENTVKTHIRAVFQALQVENRTQAVIRASELGLKLDSPMA